ncbi:MAG: efflux RND transporter permease subunit [Rhodomicrobium sp.]
MALNVSSWSIRKPLPAIVVSIALLIMGALNFERLPRTKYPNVDIPVISVTVTEFGAPPIELESQVTKAIEDAVAGVDGVSHIESSITDGISTTAVIFKLETSTDRALNDVKDAVTRARGNLPATVDEPLIHRVDVVGQGIVTYAAIAPSKTPEQLSWFVSDVVKRRLQSIPGVGSVERIGGVDREISVSLDPDRLQAVGLTAAGVSRILKVTSLDLAGGRADIGGGDQSIRTLGARNTIDDLAATRIALPAGGDLRLDDIGIVTDSITEPATFARLNGKPVVAFTVLRARGASDVAVAKAIEDKVASLEAEYPDVKLKLIDTSVTHTVENFNSAMSTFFEGAALAIVVVLLFLRDIRATIIAAIALPFSILPTFWVMQMLGFSLNLITLLAISLSTGILVDDAIVEIENIVRHIRMGESPYQAAMEAADEIGLAVIAISLTIVAVFIPVSFMGGIVGQFFKQFGITISVQVIFSLLVARFITPMLAAYFIGSGKSEKNTGGYVSSHYTELITTSLRHKYLTVGIGIFLFALSIYALKLLPSGFIPEQDRARSVMAVELPSGSQLQDTQAVTDAIVKRLQRYHEIKTVFVDGGRIPPDVTEIRKAALVINYVPKSERSMSQAALERKIGEEIKDIPDIRFWFLDEDGKRPVSLLFTGRDSVLVRSVASEVAKQIKTLPAVSNVIAAAAIDAPELRISPKMDLCARLGITTQDLSETVRVATIGDVPPALAKFNANGRLIPVRVKFEDRARADKQALEQLRVPSPTGMGVPLGAVAGIEFGQAASSINRHDRERQAEITGDLSEGYALSDALKQIYSLPIIQSLPQGVTINESGAAELLSELMGEFRVALIEGLLMVYIVLVLLFGSVLHPLTILFSLPLAFGGAILGLVITGQSLNLPVLIGMLMLAGIVTKNAIMLVDFAIEAIDHGAERTQAIISACQKRARPIIMTTVAMTAGMLPSALSFGVSAETRSPMAIAVISGLLVSTSLSLIFVPTFFAVMDDSGAFLRRLMSGSSAIQQPKLPS